jgi:flagellar biosynthesis/type III secretory pathway M-ring protein FliF/YscJ
MAMAAVAVALIGFFAFLILRVTAVPMTPLFTDLAFEDSSAIIRDLERQAIPYQTRNDPRPQGCGDQASHEACGVRPAQGRRRGL